MDLNQYQTISPKLTKVKFWEGMEPEIDLDALSRAAIPVKGVSYHSPLRFLQIFAEGLQPSKMPVSFSDRFIPNSLYSWRNIENIFFPKISGVHIKLGEQIAQPPFAWRDADASYLGVSFTYNTNALYRIINTFQETHQLSIEEVDALLDRACLILSSLYKTRNYFLLRNINNNFNMLLISKVVEFLVGKDWYDCNCQEIGPTRRSLSAALKLAADHQHLSVLEKMSIAVAKGVTFIESRLSKTGFSKQEEQHVQNISYQHFSKSMAIDDRVKLLNMISNAGVRKNTFTLVAILDDATETVDDLLWMFDLMKQFRFLRIHLLVNTAQVSINFSAHMLKEVLEADCFRGLASLLGMQFLITEIYCPFISFQTEYLPPHGRRVIEKADAVYIKGANFFETCQIKNKETFHAFTVYGPISQTYTGLRNLDAVFVHLPAGVSGYVHHPEPEKIITLAKITHRLARNSPHVT